MTTLADVLAEHALDDEWDCIPCDSHFSTMMSWAAHVEEKIREAGLAVTQLPKPALDLWDESDKALFQEESCTPIRVHWSGQVIYGSDWLHPTEARSDAAALLAAAEMAEQVNA